MSDYFPRNWQGYSGHPPKFHWPGNKRLIVNLTLNYEEGAEHNILDGAPYSENYLSGFPGLPSLEGARHFSSESLFAYGSRVGCWRLLNLFNQYKVPITVFACGLALERNPAFAKALGKSDHEIAGHGYRWISYRDFPMEDERLDIEKTLSAIKTTTGKTAVGWYTGRKSENTRKLVMEVGLLYDSDDYSDDVPWWLTIHNRRHLVIPYTLLNNDCLYCTSPGWVTPGHFFSHLKDTFNGLYREGLNQACVMSVGLHSRISGHPGRAEAIRRFIEHVRQHDQADFATRSEIAYQWLACNRDYPS